MADLKFIPIQFTEDNIGPHLMESITKGLYVNPLHTIREYVQNEIESVPPPKKIKVHIDGREISIWGDGGGMNREMILNSAMKIGFSTKDPTKDLGFRGIGIWSGIAVCDLIMISTKRKGEDKEYLVRIDGKGIRDEIRRKNKRLTSVLTENVSIAENAVTSEEHGTHVMLKGILADRSGEDLLSHDNVMSYMQLTLPVDFDPEFKYKDEISQKLQKNVPNYRSVEIFLEDQPVYRAPFLNDLDPPDYYVLSKGKKELAYCWFCLHEKSRLIGDPQSRGLVYKKHGFTIGNRAVCANWWTKSPHLSNWCVGEIHVVDTSILPNAEREDFESGQEKDALISQLQDLIQAGVEEGTRRKSLFDNMRERIGYAFNLPTKPTFADDTEKAARISEASTLQRHLKQAQNNKFTTKYGSTEDKERLKNAIERIDGLLKTYAAAQVLYKQEKLSEPQHSPIMLEAQKAPQVEAFPEPACISFSDLLKGVKLDLESQAILGAVEEVLEEYFADDLQLSNEIKGRIVSKIRKIRGS